MQTIRLLLCLLTVVGSIQASAQTELQRDQCEKSYAPQSGQPGKDVVWVPTPDHLVTAMLQIANTKAQDVVYDLGAGDGKIAIAAAKQFGARAVGVEYNEKLVQLATCLIEAAGVGGRAKVVHGDIFKTDFSEATVVTMYLLPELNLKLRPTLLKMKPGTRIVSHSFSMGDWVPDEEQVVRGADRIYLWTIPARVEGSWTLRSQGAEPLVVRLEQSSLTFTGVVLDAGKLNPVQEPTLRGNTIGFRYNGPNGLASFKGTVSADRIEGTLTNDQGTKPVIGTRQ